MFEYRLFIACLLTALVAFALGAVFTWFLKKSKNVQPAEGGGDGHLLKFIHENSQGILSILDQPRLHNRIVETLTTAFNLERALLFLPEQFEAGPYVMKAQYGEGGPNLLPCRIQREDFLVTALRQGLQVLVVDGQGDSGSDLTLAYAQKRMAELGGAACIPFLEKGELTGFCLVGGKKDGTSFSATELRILLILAGYAAVAIENARLFDSVRNMKTSLRRSDRLASLGTLTAGLAHEIRNPLVSVHTFLQLLPERYEDEEFRTQFHELACDEIERLNLLMEELLAFARPSDPNLRPTSLNDTVEKMLMLIGSECKKKGIEIVRGFSDNIPEVIMDREQMKQVLMNVFLNAVQAMPAGGTLEVHTMFLADAGQSGFVQVEVKDTGVGIAEKDLESLFNPFFTTKEQGTGLGLSIAHQIVREHRGFIDVDSKKGYGSTFFITLPVNPRIHERRRGRRAEGGRI